MMNIIFIAPLAAGKGTVSDYLKENLNYEHISTGNLFREIIQKKDDLGLKIENIIKSGKLVDDELTLEVLMNKLNTLDKNKLFILDGFPRNINQAKMLDQLLISRGVTNNVVIFLNIDENLALKRTLGRMICPKCGKSYNINFQELKPKVLNMCDNCNISLIKRDDDTEETFKKRFETYLKETTEVINYYINKGLLKEVDANQNINDVIKDVLVIINGDEK